MKRYLVFAGSHYYPSGGWDDYKGSFDNLQECYRFLGLKPYLDWLHVVDSTTGDIVYRTPVS